MKLKSRIVVALFVVSMSAPLACAGDPAPIHVISEVHCAPMSGFSVEAQEDVYNEWVSAVTLGLDDIEALGGRLSYLSTGQFMEWVLERPTTGLPLMQRLYASGGQLGTHMHSKRRASLFNWVPADTSTIPNIQAMWDDHIGLVDTVINVGLGITDPTEVRVVNSLLGTHEPSDNELRMNLMGANGFVGHEQGPCEEFFVYFNHYAMNPWRPSGVQFLEHDPDGHVVLVPFGPGLGKHAVHFGILQDMRLPAVQARFLLEILNWLDDAHIAHTGKVWVSGWGAHCHDLMAGTETREAWIPTFSWFNEYFVDVLVGGSIAATFSTIPDAREAYLNWETAHPGETSFDYPELGTDWQKYPYLVAAARYLVDARLAASLPAVGDVQLHRLVGSAEDDPHVMYVAYVSGSDGATEDLSRHISETTIAVVNPRIGTWDIVPTTAVPIPVEGVILVPVGRTRTITMFGDLNGDGRIAGADLALVLAAWGGTGDADFNGDGIVNGGDLSVVLANWTS